jgi:hypothetical protein
VTDIQAVTLFFFIQPKRLHHVHESIQQTHHEDTDTGHDCHIADRLRCIRRRRRSPTSSLQRENHVSHWIPRPCHAHSWQLRAAVSIKGAKSFEPKKLDSKARSNYTTQWAKPVKVAFSLPRSYYDAYQTKSYLYQVECLGEVVGARLINQYLQYVRGC